jgi:hypothetical protein
LRVIKKVNNGRGIDLILTKPPQPYFYLYYIRLRVMKKVNNGSDILNNNKDPPQPYFYLYYII